MEQFNRDIAFDNLKGIMIYLVLLGHFIELFVPYWTRSPLLYHTYYCIYVFHIPVFTFISGFFSRNSAVNSNVFLQALRSCLIPYLFFQILYSLIFFVPKGSLTKNLLTIFDIATPQWMLWYMLSMFFWRIMVQFTNVLRWPLVLSVLLAVYIGVTEARVFLSLSRTITFFPFFLAGYLTTPATLAKLRKKNRWIGAFLFFAAIAVTLRLAASGIQLGHIRMAQPYDEFPQPVWQAMLLRLTSLGLGFVCIYALIILIGGHPTVLSSFGRYSLTIFLLHSGIYRLVTRILHLTVPNKPPALLYAALSAFLLCFLLGRKSVDRLFRSLFQNIALIFLIREDKTS